jgi:hypothetical protein
MSKYNIGKKLLGLAVLSATIALNACKDEDPTALNPSTIKPSTAFVGLTASNQLVRYRANNTDQVVSSNVLITGLQTNETIIAIDYRPFNKTLYGLGSTSRLYTIPVPASTSATSTSATLVGVISPALPGTVAGFDFNPVADRIRIVTTSGQNLRVNPADGSAVLDEAINGVAGAVVTGSAYTNNMVGATTTVLYNIDVANQMLYKQEPNSGTLSSVGSLGSTPLPLTNASYSGAYNTNITNARSSAAGGFDIGADGTALVVFNNLAAPAIPVNGIAAGNPASAVNASSGSSTLFQIDLETGRVNQLGLFASGLIGIAIQP